jgi:homeodomain-containing protein
MSLTPPQRYDKLAPRRCPSNSVGWTPDKSNPPRSEGIYPHPTPLTPQFHRWIQVEKDGLVGFGEVATGRGRKPSISDEKVAEIVDLTLHSKPEGETHWSCRSMAKRAGVSSASVQRIWSARGLKPHLVKTFKLSNDRHFEEKLIDVVGLYLNPPDQAVVLCMDEKSQIQALDRTQPSLPMKGTVALSKPGAGWIPFPCFGQIATVSSVKAAATRSVVDSSTPSS